MALGRHGPHGVSLPGRPGLVGQDAAPHESVPLYRRGDPAGLYD